MRTSRKFNQTAPDAEDADQTMIPKPVLNELRLSVMARIYMYSMTFVTLRH